MTSEPFIIVTDLESDDVVAIYELIRKEPKQQHTIIVVKHNSKAKAELAKQMFPQCNVIAGYQTTEPFPCVSTVETNDDNQLIHTCPRWVLNRFPLSSLFMMAPPGYMATDKSLFPLYKSRVLYIYGGFNIRGTDCGEFLKSFKTTYIAEMFTTFKPHEKTTLDQDDCPECWKSLPPIIKQHIVNWSKFIYDDCIDTIRPFGVVEITPSGVFFDGKSAPKFDNENEWTKEQLIAKFGIKDGNKIWRNIEPLKSMTKQLQFPLADVLLPLMIESKDFVPAEYSVNPDTGYTEWKECDSSNVFLFKPSKPINYCFNL